ncbi:MULTISPECIES: Lrp/AsnC family transcriptional regulator [Paraburkholderia]|uniref:Transcriptional regulator, AsnC family n=1 Tax=Paraburkholderia megapolitana TaxID=420953 RepID=A0A1I3LF42_9BURK|nr:MULTISPECIES: Lrp/AsnC family transcriptional regulator [Paraburkholderia]MCX4164215.1 Lrp/AsnC family transcriptional regulator [Paraburkholderia megapolitana]MDN7159709.1 Lrp/AsnC family transcriptional regulator [Paraburkholderia sp. CHISQ3]MDQ6496756.1 Lrp/AsnC family transcriptional regulator [Paraburkholderia megapolitana]QDQ80676.1 Lrp/AsnC family transcriptional regulator [Paraburkholderia megapolitana]SFI83015.1 transcriptional regulator, AsnC family [Paraburkholderia megapolitana]
MTLDRLDVQILNLLQEDASMPLRALAERVHSSVATCQRRINQLKADGVLIRQVAIVDRMRVGRALTAFVSVELDRQNNALLRAFEKRMAAEADVMACYEVSGEFDFMLIVNSTSMDAYHAFTRRVFSSNNNVRNFKSNFAMNCSKFETKIALDEPSD